MLPTDALPNEQSSLPSVIQLSKIMRSLHLLMISAFFFLGASESLAVSAIPAYPDSAVERRCTQPKVSPPPFLSTKILVEILACSATTPWPTNGGNDYALISARFINSHRLLPARNTNPLRLSRTTFLYRQPEMRQRPSIRELVQPRGRLPWHLRSTERTGMRWRDATRVSIG